MVKKGKHYSIETEFKKGMNPWNKGIPKKEETKRKAVETRMKRGSYVAWNKGLTKKDNVSVMNISKHMSGKRNSMYRKEPWNKGLIKEIDERVMNISKKLLRENNGSWSGGISFEPYGLEFNKDFRNKIRQRDNQICMNCGIHKEKLKTALSIHHINYDKKLNIKENCISLCKKCHTITNFNRKYWVELFQDKLFRLYGYSYSREMEVVLNLK